MRTLAYKLARRVLMVYWWLFRPKTYGVKVVLIGNDGLWLIQNSYHSDKKWNLPGGGYNPRKELALEAANRELGEELSYAGAIELCPVFSYLHTAEYKRDEVSIFEGRVVGVVKPASVEISKVKYFKYSQLKNLDLSRSLEKYLTSKGIPPTP